MRTCHSVLAPILLTFLMSAITSGADLIQSLDVAYGDDPLQQLDIYAPKSAAGRRPCIVWVHGGGWEGGDKRIGGWEGGHPQFDGKGIQAFAEEAVDHGYVMVSVNYRLAPKDPFPAQLDDVHRAVRWLRANSEKYQIDPERIGATGVSAGGHLVCMMAVHRTRTVQNDDLDKFSSGIRAGVSLAGPTDFQEAPELMTRMIREAIEKQTGKDPDKFAAFQRQASPVHFVTKTAPPLRLVIGELDDWIPPAHARAMEKRLKEHDVPTDIIIIADTHHGVFPASIPKVSTSIFDWFEKYLKNDGQ